MNRGSRVFRLGSCCVVTEHCFDWCRWFQVRGCGWPVGLQGACGHTSSKTIGLERSQWGLRSAISSFFWKRFRNTFVLHPTLQREFKRRFISWKVLSLAFVEVIAQQFTREVPHHQHSVRKTCWQAGIFTCRFYQQFLVDRTRIYFSWVVDTEVQDAFKNRMRCLGKSPLLRPRHQLAQLKKSGQCMPWPTLLSMRHSHWICLILFQIWNMCMPHWEWRHRECSFSNPKNLCPAQAHIQEKRLAEQSSPTEAAVRRHAA